VTLISTEMLTCVKSTYVSSLLKMNSEISIAQVMDLLSVNVHSMLNQNVDKLGLVMILSPSLLISLLIMMLITTELLI
jgi:hypothetical protein